MSVLPPLPRGVRMQSSISAYCMRRKYANIKFVTQPERIRRRENVIYAISMNRAKSLYLRKIENKHHSQENQNNNQKDDGPMVDEEVNSVIQFKTMISDHHGKINIEVLPPIPLISDPSFEQIFRKKIKICKYIFDFTDPQSEVEEKEMKTKALCELVSFFEQSFDSKKLDIELQNEIFSMIRINCFRVMPPIQLKRLLIDYTVEIVEPSWPQLFYVYNILHSFAKMFPENPNLNLHTCMEAIYLTNFPDHSERLQLIAFLRILYDTHREFEDAILNKIRSNLLDVIDKTRLPFCVMPSLVFLSHIISRSSQSKTPKIQSLIREVIFPLVTNTYLPAFASQYLALLANALPPNDQITADFFDYLLKHWPKSSGLKACHFLELMFFSTARLSLDAISKRGRKLSSILRDTLISPHTKEREIVLEFLSTQSPQWLEKESHRLITDLYFPIRAISVDNESILKDKAAIVLQQFGKLNKNAFLKMRGMKNDVNALKKYMETERSTAKQWSQIFQSCPEKIDITEKKREIKAHFHYKPENVTNMFV